METKTKVVGGRRPREWLDRPAKSRPGYWESPLTDWRVKEILEAIDEVWWNKGKTDFATPEELIQVILHLRQELRDDKYVVLVKTHEEMLKLLKQFIKNQKHEKIRH